ncbi:MAG: class I SAM-dependent methyltransferase [Deinococcota bacterium]
MSDKRVSEHYLHGDLLKEIWNSIKTLGKTTETITIEDLAPVDEFHIGGRAATEHFMSQLNFSSADYLLDIGCGLGGAARFVASTYGSRVAGVDLSSEYVQTGTALNKWVNLDEHIYLQEASALSLPFSNDVFNGSYMMHVGMNIENKAQLFTEVFRVLKSGAVFGIYDIMQIGNNELNFPVPWASEKTMSFLATPEHYKHALHDTSFRVAHENNRHEFAMGFFKAQREKTEALGGPPPLGLHTLMQNTTSTKLNNMIQAVSATYIAPVEIVAYKP